MAQGGAVLQQVGGEAVAQCVRRNAVPNFCFLAAGFQNVPNPLPGQPFPPVVDEQSWFILSVGPAFDIWPSKYDASFIIWRNLRQLIFRRQQVQEALGSRP